MDKLYCSQCGEPIDDWYMQYGNKIFCERNDNQCIKEYLYEKFYDEFIEDCVDEEYDMSHVDDDQDYRD